MKKLSGALVLAVAAVGLAAALPLPAQAQAPGAGSDLKARVSAVVGRFPAETAAARDALAAEILALGAAAVAETCARVLPPEAGDDAKARFAVSALAVRATRPGAETERLLLVKALVAAAAASPDKDVAAFFLSQVQLAGKAEAVKPLSGFLGDAKLAGPAAAALQAIGGPEASKAVLKALDKAPRSAKAALVDALGAMRSREAARKILALAASGDETLRRAARAALANIGDPLAGPALASVRVDASTAERAEAPSLYLLYARRARESGRTSEALEAARALTRAYERPEESQVASAALELIVSVLGEEALPDLLRAAGGPSAALRGSALELAAPLGSAEATALWIEKAGAAGPETRAAIVEMLGRRGDKTALPFVRELLGSEDVTVRLAAIPAAVRLGGDAVLPDLIRINIATDESTAAAVKTALLGFDGSLVVPEILRDERLQRTLPPGRAVLVDVLGEKGARGEIDLVFGLLSDDARPEPSTRAAAMGALAKLAGEAELPRLVAMLERATDADDIIRLQDAVAAAAARGLDPARRGSALVGLLQDATPGRKAAILRVLPKIGGEPALRAAVAETAGPDSQVQTAAVYALSQWPDFRAAEELHRVATTTASRRHRLLAVEGYVRLVVRSGLPGPKKLERLRDLLGRPFDDADKKAVVTGAAAVREPEALRLLSESLSNPVLADAAAAALLDLASEQAAHERWLSGHEACSALRRVQARAAADPVEHERIGALIAARLRQGGFVPLFDGRTLAGWKGLVADPPARARMTAGELAAAQAEADARMRAHWSVAGGALVFDGRGESLCTAADYGDFELLVDWKIGAGGDSGIYLRGSPQVQIWDAAANTDGSGGLYNNQKGPSRPKEKADRPVGEWNAFRIVMIGERAWVYLNDRLVVDGVALENYWEREKPIYPAGQIELQAHGNPLSFRNIYVREIPRDTAGPSSAGPEAGEGFVPLFNGRDLSGWTGGGGGYAAEDGKIVVRPELGGGNLYTEKEYADFILRFEFKLTPAANNGLGVRAPLEGDAAYAGMEIQILEDGSPVYRDLRPYQYHGSIYGVVPARRGHLRPPGEWNAEEVTVRGRRVTVAVNGAVVVDADLDAASAGGTIDGREHPGLKRASGRVGFLGHGSVVEFRNIRIKELK